jgi:hypothetical protein
MSIFSEEKFGYRIKRGRVVDVQTNIGIFD